MKTNLLKENLYLRAFGLMKIPLIFFCRPKIQELTSHCVRIQLPLNWFTRNHHGSMYFGALAVGADIAGAILAMKLIRESGKNISLIFKDFQGQFLRRPDADVEFVCTDGDLIQDLVRRTINSADRHVLPVKIRAYVSKQTDSVPSLPDHSLYLRPVMFGVDKLIKMGRANTYHFYILSSIAGSYFAGKTNIGAKVLVNRQFVRAYPGGLGEAKTAANYAASLGPLAYAAKLGCDQLLYLQAADHDHIDELGGMNFFIVRGDTLVTPNLSGTILDGVTRRSIIEMAPELGLKAMEEPISFTRLMEEIASGKVTECFACGTAAVVQPLAELLYEEKQGQGTKPIRLSPDFKVSSKLLERLSKVQRGAERAPGKWVFEV